MTVAEINKIHASGKAIPNKLYYCDNGDTFIGTKEGRLKLQSTIASNNSNSYLQNQIDSLQSQIDSINTTITGSYVPQTRTLTINGATYDLSANRTWTIPTVSVVTNNYLPISDGTDYVDSYLSQDTNGIIVDSGKKIQSSTTNQYLSFVTSGGAPTRSARLYATTGLGTGIGEVRAYELGGRIGLYTDDGTDTTSTVQSTLAIIITGSNASFQGLEGAADYSANYDALSYVQKTYADATYAPISVTGNLTVGTTTIASGTNTRILYDNAGVLGEYTISGSGSVAMTGSPAFTGTPTAPTAASGTNDTTIATTAFVAASVPPTVKLFNYYNFI